MSSDTDTAARTAAGLGDDAAAPARGRSGGSTISQVPYLPGLDGLRALAVVAVMVYHANPDWLPGGYLGVEVFFVISGYLITLLLSVWVALFERDALGQLRGDVIAGVFYGANWYQIFIGAGYSAGADFAPL